MQPRTVSPQTFQFQPPGDPQPVRYQRLIQLLKVLDDIIARKSWDRPQAGLIRLPDDFDPVAHLQSAIGEPFQSHAIVKAEALRLLFILAYRLWAQVQDLLPLRWSTFHIYRIPSTSPEAVFARLYVRTLTLLSSSHTLTKHSCEFAVNQLLVDPERIHCTP